LVESVSDTVAGIEAGSWIDSTIGGVATGMDALATVLDPLGSLVSWGVAWLMEHVKPLSDALDWLAGDPDQITAFAQTWRNVAASCADVAEEFRTALGAEIAEWGGPSAEAYRRHAAEQLHAMVGIGRAAGGVGSLVELSGLLVALVRELVRDLIADFVSILAVRLPMWLAEAGLTLGAATPLVVSQVGSLVAKWAARIAKVVAALIRSLRRVGPMIGRLGDLVDELSDLLRRLARRDGDSPAGQGSGTPHEPEPPAPSEDDRLRDLGMDPATGRHRPAETETAARIEEHLGVTLQRAPAGSSADWIDASGRTYDAVGNFPGDFFDRQWPQLQYQIQRHLDKADLVPVDVSRFSPEQAARVARFIADNNLGPRVFIVGL
jgi:hypothetical protein